MRWTGSAFWLGRSDDRATVGRTFQSARTISLFLNRGEGGGEGANNINQFDYWLSGNQWIEIYGLRDERSCWVITHETPFIVLGHICLDFALCLAGRTLFKNSSRLSTPSGKEVENPLELLFSAESDRWKWTRHKSKAELMLHYMRTPPSDWAADSSAISNGTTEENVILLNCRGAFDSRVTIQLYPRHQPNASTSESSTSA